MSRTSPLLSTLVLLAAATASTAPAQDYGSRGNLGATATAAERAEMEALYERFIPYIDKARTEPTMVRETVAYAEARGFRECDPQVRNPSPGDRFYAVNRDRACRTSALLSETSFEIQLFRRLALAINLNVAHGSETPTNVKETDVVLSNWLRYSF